MANFYKYSYLNAHDYLEKFKEGLKCPYLTRALLTKLLKVYYRNHKRSIDCDFIIKDDYGNLALYNRDFLNRMLGIDRTGFKYQNDTIYLRELRDYLDNWEYDAAKKDAEDSTAEKEGKPVDPMKAASDELIYNDNFNPEIDESVKKVRKVFLTESQIKTILESEAQRLFFDPRKVIIVKNFLDKNFTKCAISGINNEGQPSLTPMVAMNVNGQPGDQMTDIQLFYYLQDKFQNIFSDEKNATLSLRK